MPANNTPDSYAPVIAEFLLLANGVASNIQWSEYLRSLVVSQSTSGAWSATLVLFDPDTDDRVGKARLEDLIVSAAAANRLLMRFGHDYGQGVESLPQYAGRIAKYQPTFTPHGVEMTLDVVPDIALQALLDRQIRSWPGELHTVSDLVRQIAEARGWRIVDDKRQPTIQDSPVKLPETCQVGETDIRFIREQLVPYALDEKGRGGFVFFIDVDGSAHFHNAYFRPPRVAATYVFGRDSAGQVISFEPEDSSLFAVAMGGGNTVFEAQDTNGGTRTQVAASVIGGLTGVPNIAWRDGGFTTDLGKALHSRVAVFERDPELLKARAANQYAFYQNQKYPARLVVNGTHAVRPMDHIIVEYVRRDGRKHHLSGTFLVAAIDHRFDTGGWVTEMTLSRASIPEVAGTVKQDVDAQHVPIEDAQTQTTRSATQADPTVDVGGARHTARPGSGEPGPRAR